MIPVSYQFYRQSYLSGILLLSNHLLEMSLTSFLCYEAFSVLVVPVSYKFYTQSSYIEISLLKTSFLKKSPKQLLIQVDHSCFSGTSFLSFLQTILPERYPIFKKPLIKNESKPVSYTMQTFPVLLVPVSYQFYRQSYYKVIPHLRDRYLKISLNQFFVQ